MDTFSKSGADTSVAASHEWLGESGGDTSKQSSNIRLLLIEDNCDDARLTERLLNASSNPKFQVRTAFTLGEGMKYLKSGGVDIALVDLNLPDSRGIDTVVKIRQFAGDIPVLVLTGNEAPQTVLDSVKAGARDYFVKSRVEPAELLRSIYRQLASRG
jgi:DNA-binding response OmpR family regulator